MTAKFLAVLLLFALPIQAKTLIEKAYEAGELDLETALIYQVLSVRAPNQLPAIYRESDGLAVCGTPHLVQAMSAAPDLSAEYQARLGKLAQRRPDVQHNLLSPSGRFRVHYDTEGRHAVALTDDDANGIPDYIDLTMAVLDSIWVLEIDQLGYNPPPSDKGLGGGDEYDAYVIELGGSYYGYAYPEVAGATTTSSYLEVDNNFTDLGYRQTRGLDALRVTIAHEFHHAIQFGYYATFDGSWWQESTSTWMEEVAYPHVDDYLQYLTYFLGEPQRALNSGVFRSLHTYGSAIFSFFLDQRYGRELNRLIWEEVGQRKSVDLAHFDRVIRQVEPGGLGVAAGEFAVWNYFTGNRYRGEYYAEGDKYPTVPTRDIAVTDEAVVHNTSLDATGSVYLRLKPQLRRPGGVDLFFNASQGAWRRHLLLVGPDNVSVQFVSGPTVRVRGWDQFDEVVLVATSTEYSGLAYEHLFTAQFDPNLTDRSTLPQITSISPSRVRYNQVVAIRGTGFGANRGTSRVIFHGGKEPSSSQYRGWSDTQIHVMVPTGARTGNVQVVTTRGRDSARLTITSPWISRVSPQAGKTNAVVTISGGNFGSSRGSSTVRIGSVAIPSSSLASWSNTRIRFRVPTNVRSGNVTVRTSAGTSNAIRLEITSPYLARVSPSRVKLGDRLTLTGANFRSIRGSSYVLFAPNVRPSSGDYVTWSDSRIVVEVPVGAQSGDVKVVTGAGTSGAKRIVVEGEVVESLPSRGLFGYSSPAVTKNPKSVKFGFEGIGEDVAMTWSLKNDAVVDILVNGKDYGWIPVSNDWEAWWTTLSQMDLNSGQNVIEFRNRANQNRTSSFTHWLLKDVKLWKPFNAKVIAGAKFLESSRSIVESGLGNPFPTPFNAEVTIPFVLVEAGPIRISVYNLMGQSIRMLADDWVDAGAHRVRWDGRTAEGAEAASGVYWAVLHTGEIVQTAKLVLIR